MRRILAGMVRVSIAAVLCGFVVVVAALWAVDLI
jgi:nitrogen fixation-related uncharacterized protein